MPRSVFELYTWWDWASKLVLAGGTVVLLRSFLSLTHLKAALDALVGSNPEEEEVGMDLDPDLVYWCNIRLVNSW